MKTPNDEYWMQQALEQARTAEKEGEVPVGAVLVRDDELIATGSNQSISLVDPTAHAEVIAIREAAKVCGNYRLIDTSLYVTLEPCAMCAGALVHARIKRLFFGAYDPNSGSAGSVFNILDSDKLNHKVEIMGGILEQECSELIQGFFRRKRN